MKKLLLLLTAFVLIGLTSWAQPSLYWQYNNVVVYDNAGVCTLAFDVEVASDVAGTYGSSMQLYFDYNPVAFGTNVVLNGNISFAPGTLLQGNFGGNPLYSVVGYADNTPNRFAVVTEANYLVPDVMFMNQIPQYPVFASYFHVEMVIASELELAGIDFVPSIMDGGEYYCPAMGVEEKYGVPPDYPGTYVNDLLAQTLACGSPCEAIPYSQTFDADLNWPAGWSTTDPSIWYIDPYWPGSTPPTGNHVYSQYWPYGTATVYSPCFDGTGKTDLHARFFHFWQANYSTGLQDGYFYGSPDGGATSYLLEEWHHLTPAVDEGWQTYDISAWADGATNIVFWWTVVHNDDWYWVWDDFEIQEGPWIITTPGLWTGLVDNNWFDTGNWSDGVVPASTQDVNIPAGCPNYPILTTGVAECNNITVQFAGSLTINGGGELDCSGSMTNIGTVTNSGVLYIVGDYNSTPGCVFNQLGGTWDFQWFWNAGNWGDGTAYISGGTIYCQVVLAAWTTWTMTGNFDWYIGEAARFELSFFTANPDGGTVHITGLDNMGNPIPDVYVYSPYSGGSFGCYNLEIGAPAGTNVWTCGTFGQSNIEVFGSLYLNSGNLNTAQGGVPNSFFDVFADLYGAADNGNNLTIDAGTTFIVFGTSNLNLVATPTAYPSVIGNFTTNVLNYNVSYPALGAGKWALITPPVNNALANTFICQYLEQHDPVTNTWSDIIDPVTPLVPGVDYALWVHPDAFVSGDVNCPTIAPLTSYTWTGTKNDWVPVTVPVLTGWNNVGNPYLAACDWNAAGWNKTNVNDAIYFESDGTWATYVGGVGSNGGTQYISPAQGFFVECGPGGGVLGFDPSVTTHTRATYYKDDVSNLLRLQATGNSRSDETVIRFHESATAGFDSKFDAHKMFNDATLYPQVPQLFSLDNNFLAINALESAQMVDLGFRAGVAGEYTISATEVKDFDYVVLEDLSTGSFTDLLQGSYTFNYTPGENDGRFIVHFVPKSSLVPSSSIVYTFDNVIHVNVPESVTGDIAVYNLMGQEIIRTSINSVFNEITMNQTGSYIVKVFASNGTVAEKVYIK